VVQYLSLLFGSTIQAQTVVLAVFMGGLAVGNRLFGSRAVFCATLCRSMATSKSPSALRLFLCLCLPGRRFHFPNAGRPLLSHRGLLLTLKAILSLALLLGPTILMGGTLPLLASWLEDGWLIPPLGCPLLRYQ